MGFGGVLVRFCQLACRTQDPAAEGLLFRVAHGGVHLHSSCARGQLGRKVLKKDASRVTLTEGEKTQFRGVLASLAWVAREGRPDAAAAASILAGTFPEPTVADVLGANEMVRHLKHDKAPDPLDSPP